MVRRHASFALAALAVALGTPLARADAQRCLAAAERAQELRDGAKLRAAREQLLMCSNDDCPAAVRSDCTKWLDEVRARMPTATFRVKDATGRDLTDARLTVDGEKRLDRIDGRLVELDPGPHRVRVETAASTLEESIVIHEAQKNRGIELVVKTGAGTNGSTSSSEGSSTASRPIPVLTGILAGVGLLAVGGFAYFAADAKSDVDGMRASCAPACAQSDIDDTRTKLLVANASLGAAVLAFAGAAVLFFTRPSVQPVKSSVGSQSTWWVGQ